ncbi:hypothetical protein HA402_015118 [Bradysia odoriphaga]|nr:hypothetical protein HA402_015118 [Bradysia odoriphaga]
MHTEYRLNHFTDLCQETKKPLTKRLTYTCVDVSNYIVFGASSGSLYIFRLNPCEFLQLIQNVHGSITNVRISPNDKFIAFSTDKGMIGVYLLDFDAQEPTVLVSKCDETQKITFIEWKNEESHLFIGNKKGIVSIVFIDMLFNRTLTGLRINPILYLESPIVQISNFDRLLLVSTYARCILCDMKTEQFKQIGNTPRDGYYGACFLPIYNQYSEVFLKIYCARPGSRIWESDLNGNVLQTSQFKAALACAPTKLHATYTRLPEDCVQDPQILQLARLHPVLKKFILGFTRTGFYIFDPNESRVVLWSDEIKDIVDIRVSNSSTLHIFTLNGELFSVELVSLEEQFLDILQERKYEQTLCVLFQHGDYLREKLVPYRLKLKQICEYLKNVGETEVVMELESNFNDILAGNDENISRSATRLENGIFIVHPTAYDEILPKFTQTLRINGEALLADPTKPNQIDQFESSPEDYDTIVSNRRRTVSAIVHHPPVQSTASSEEKQLQNLVMICKSQSISRTTLVDRYAGIFDELDCSGIQVLLSKVEGLLIENGESETEARRQCFEMYFNYLMPNVISEMEDPCLDYLIDGIILVNKQLTETTLRCTQCTFPILIRYKDCKYEDIAVEWLKLMWLRGARDRCIKVIKAFPSVTSNIIQMMFQDSNVDLRRVILLVFASQSNNLLKQVAKLCTDDAMRVTMFQLMVLMHSQKQMECFECSQLSPVQFDDNQVYSWSDFLNMFVDVSGVSVTLDLLKRHARLMPKDVVPKEFYLKCIAN